MKPRDWFVVSNLPSLISIQSGFNLTSKVWNVSLLPARRFSLQLYLPREMSIEVTQREHLTVNSAQLTASISTFSTWSIYKRQIWLLVSRLFHRRQRIEESSSFSSAEQIASFVRNYDIMRRSPTTSITRHIRFHPLIRTSHRFLPCAYSRQKLLISTRASSYTRGIGTLIAGSALWLNASWIRTRRYRLKCRVLIRLNLPSNAVNPLKYQWHLLTTDTIVRGNQSDVIESLRKTCRIIAIQ